MRDVNPLDIVETIREVVTGATPTALSATGVTSSAAMTGQGDGGDLVRPKTLGFFQKTA